MTIRIKPTKIKNSTYLLVPKDIAELVDIDDTTKFSLKIKQNGKRPVLEFQIE
jgi:hypothetical protein